MLYLNWMWLFLQKYIKVNEDLCVELHFTWGSSISRWTMASQCWSEGDLIVRNHVFLHWCSVLEPHNKKIHLFISEYLLLCCLYNRWTIFGYFISCATMGELTVQNEGSDKLLSSLLQEQASARVHKEATLFSSIQHLMEPVYFKQTSPKFQRFTYLSSIYGYQVSLVWKFDTFGQ